MITGNIIKFKASAILYSIEKVTVIKETDKFLTLVHENHNKVFTEYRVLKSTEYTCYFDTFEAAKDYLVSSIDNELFMVTRKRNLLMEELIKVQNLIEDTNCI